MEQRACTVHQFSTCVWKQTEWRCLKKEALPLLVDNTECEMFKAGEEIFGIGDPATGVFLIERGLVSLERDSLDGEPVLFRLAGPGDTLGYQAVLNGKVHRGSAIALEPVRVCFIDAKFFCDVVGANARLGLEFLRKASRDINDADDRYYRVISQRARARVAYHLLQFSERYGKADRMGVIEISMPCSRTRLASLIGVRPESLSRSLGKLRDAGIIHCSGRKIFVHSIVGLEQESVGWEKMPRRQSGSALRSIAAE